jgi:hypothetical protein
MEKTKREPLTEERNKWIAICKDFLLDTNPPHKDNETYIDGWVDACNEILWEGSKEEASAIIDKPALAKPEQVNKWADRIHYPECWCTTAYPTLEDAMWEALAWSTVGHECYRGQS